MSTLTRITSGFIGTILLIAVAVGLLAYFRVDLRAFVDAIARMF